MVSTASCSKYFLAHAHAQSAITINFDAKNIHHFFMESLQDQELLGLVVPQRSAASIRASRSETKYLSSTPIIEFHTQPHGSSDLNAGVFLSPGKSDILVDSDEIVDFTDTQSNYLVIEVSLITAYLPPLSDNDHFSGLDVSHATLN